MDDKAKAAADFFKDLAAKLNPDTEKPAAAAPAPAPVDHSAAMKKAEASMKMTPETLKQLIINLYLINGRDSTVFELAAHAGVSESTIRKVLAKCHGVPDGCYMDQEIRESHSKNYRGMVSGSHKVWVYGPSRSTMRALYIESVKHINALQSRFGVPTSESEAIINAIGDVAKES